VTSFAAATAVRRRSDTAYDVDLDGGWSIGGKPNGGYLLAVLGRAAAEAADRPHPLAMSGHFLRPPDGGPAQIDVEVVKSGRTASTVRATLRQDGVARLDSLVTVGELTNAPADYAAHPMPALPPPDECGRREELPFRVELLDHVDVRLEPATAPFPQPTGRPLIRGWMAFHDGADADVLALLLAVDVMPPTVFHLNRFGWAPTVELTALLRGVPAPGRLAFEAEATYVAGGWFDESATVWDSTGRLVAQSRQLALLGRD
jgi:hypothetical protein